MSPHLTSLIIDIAGRAGIELSGSQAELCRIHIELMLEWNNRINLTRITTPEEIAVKHILDSMAPATQLPVSGRCVDVGTGAGFPGIPLKILHPEIELTLIDSSRKKVSFLSVLAAKLGGRGIRPLHGRWEDFASAPEMKNAAHLVTMRAVRLERRHLSELASIVLADGGIFAFWAGPSMEEGIEGLATDVPVLKMHQGIRYSLPGLLGQRTVLTWIRTQVSQPH